jgi:monoamine oxidase
MARSLYTLLRQRFDTPADRLSRREILQATLAASAGLLLSDRLGAWAARAPAGKRVLVIGAGFGGLAAGYELASAGYDVKVVEARNRLGGRVISFKDLVKDKVVEGGGELIGPNQPTWVAYKERFKLDFVDVSDDERVGAPIHLNGKALEPAEAKKLWDEMKDALASVNGEAEKVDADQPWTSPNAKALDRKTVADWIAGLKASPLCKYALTVQLAGYDGMHPAWESYLAHLAVVKGGGLKDYWEATDTLRCRGGSQQLAQKLADGIGASRIRLGLAATAVAVGDKSVVVTLADGSKEEVDDVVLAVPPSTWTRIAFDRPLPAGLTPQMGNNTKFLVAFTKRFWQEAKLSPTCLTDGPISTTWEATDNQKGNDGACLVLFAGGNAADTAREWTAEERAAKYLAALEQIYPGACKHFIRARYLDWPSDPWTKGSYSFPAPGEVTTAGPILREGLHGRLHFVGEHACYAFVGYMEGALNSGVALARRLAARDGVKK